MHFRAQRRQRLFCQRLPRLTADDGGADAPVDDEGCAEQRPEHLRLADERHHLCAGPHVIGLGCTGISTRSAASSAERAKAAILGGPSITT